MNTTDQPLDLSLPSRETPQAPRRTFERILLFLIIGLLGGIFWQMRLSHKGVAQKSPEVLKTLALKLEQQGLNESALSVWEEYIELEGDLSPVNVWYRMATIYQKLELHEQALASLYRAEALAPDSELSLEINQKVQDSLEALGRFATLQRELKARVGLNESVKETVVAEIGNRKITSSELDQQIEELVERQVLAFKGRLSEPQIAEQRAKMLEQFTSEPQKVQFLSTYVAQELLYTKAREEKLHQSVEMRKQLKQIEKDLIVSQLMLAQKEGAREISLSDIKSYYKDHEQEFQTPHQISLKAVKRDSKEQAQELLTKLQSSLSLNDLEEVTPLTLNVGYRLPGIDLSAQQLSLLRNVKEGEVCNSVFETSEGCYLFFVERQKPGSPQSFDEVQPQIGKILQIQKEQEIQSEFLEQLKDAYDVVIHQNAFKGTK